MNFYETIIKEQFVDNFKVLQQMVHDTATEHGFHANDENPYYVPTALALIASEVSEALEAHRKHQDDHIGEELADIVIRTMDLAESLQINLAARIIEKQAANDVRAFKHGGKRY